MAFTWTALIPGVGVEYAHVVTASIIGAGVVGAGLAARRALGSGEAAVVPAGKFSLRGLFELATEFITGLTDSTIGHHGRTFVPLFASIFVFILANNLLGLIPGFTPATENMNTTLAMGIFIFVAYNFLGIKENGLAYLKHFIGPIWWLAVLMVPLEIISHVVRPFSLAFRLANVMMGDHTVVGVFTELTYVVVPVLFMTLGIIVAFVQAFVFTLLSMVYVALATAHDH